MARVYQLRESQTSSDDYRQFLAKFEADLVTALGLLDNIRSDCVHAGESTAAGMVAGVSEVLIAFANNYLSRRM